MAPPPLNRRLGEFICQGIGFDVFANTTGSDDPMQDRAIVDRVQDIFKAKVGTGLLPQGSVRMDLNPSKMPPYTHVFIKRAKVLPISLILLAAIAAGVGDPEALKSMGCHDSVILDKYYWHRFNSLEKNPALKPYIEKAWRNPTPTWEQMYNATIQEAAQDFINSRKLDHPLNNMREVVLAVVKQDGSALLHASAALRGNRKIVLAAVQQYGPALRHASAALQGDKDVVLAAVKQNGLALFYASDALKGDKDVVLAAVKQNGFALFYASDALKGDEEVVLAAVKQNGFALLRASAALRENRKVVLAALQNKPEAFHFVSTNLRQDPEVRAAAGLRTPAPQ